MQQWFRASSLNCTWFTDTTEQATREGKLHVRTITCACSNRIMGLSVGSRMTLDLDFSALL